MRRITVRLLVVVAFAVTAVGGLSHAADPDSLTLVGFGSLSPGYPPLGCLPQTSFAFTADVVVDVGDDAGVDTAEYRGSSSGCETLLSGQGSGTLTITGLLGGGGGGGTVLYSRTGTLM